MSSFEAETNSYSNFVMHTFRMLYLQSYSRILHEVVELVVKVYNEIYFCDTPSAKHPIDQSYRVSVAEVEESPWSEIFSVIEGRSQHSFGVIAGPKPT